MSRNVLVTSVLLAVPRPIFSGVADGEDQRRRFVATDGTALPRLPQVGEVWRIAGRVTRHDVYGEQVMVDTATLEAPSGRMIVHVLAGPRFEGVGPKTAERLWLAYGEDLYRILANGDEAALAKITGDDPRGRARATAIVDAWRGLALEADTMAWLDRYAISPRLALKVIGCYGHDTVSALTADPYRLTIFGSPWADADRVALSLGIEADDPRRLGAAVEHCAYRRFSVDGDTWAAEASLSEELATLLDPASVNSALVVATQSGAILAVPDGYQTAGSWALEGYVARELATRLRRIPEIHDACAVTAAGQNVADLLDRWQDVAGIKLNGGQRRAVEIALVAPFAVITGGAGTGKTATLKAIAELASESGETIVLLALSGRAALRVTEATGFPARTIAGFLQASERAATLPERPLVVIDEASMVDLTLLYRVLSVMADRGRLLLVGDPGQLPPIGPGLTLHTLAGHTSVPVAVLDEVIRQASATGIPAAGQAIREGAVPAAITGTLVAPGVIFIESPPDRVAATAIELWRAEGHGAQLISAFKGKPEAGGGTRCLNAICHAARPPSEPMAFGRFGLGEPVIWTQNDHDLGLMNGELGVAGETRIGEEGTESLVVHFADRTVELSRLQARHLDLAYAITVHKAQGSAFDVVVIPVVAHRLLDRTMLYTALTRARLKAIFVGDRHAFRRAVTAAPSSGRRKTALSWHLDRELEFFDTHGRSACMEN